MQFDLAEQKGHKGLPTEHCIADLLVVSFQLSFQLLEETAGKVMPKAETTAEPEQDMPAGRTRRRRSAAA